MSTEEQKRPAEKKGQAGSAEGSAKDLASEDAGAQLLDVGLCTEHQRPFEAICSQCKTYPDFPPRRLVCPSCVMFGPQHKQHPVIDLQEGLKQLRTELYSQLERGKLKVEYTESVLLDIRQAILTCDQMKNKLVNGINESFTKLIKSIKARKAELLGEIDKYFEAERTKIVANEEVWKQKQKLCQDLLRLNNSTATDAELLQNSRYVFESIGKLNEPIKFQEMKLINSLNDSLIISAAAVKYVEPKEQKEPPEDEDEQKPKDIDINLHELILMLGRYMEISEYKSLQYKA